MIITAYRQQLLQLAQQAARAAPANDLIPEIGGIHVEANKEDGSVTLTATNQESTIKAMGFADVEEGGAFLIDHKIFPAMLSKLPKDEVRIETSNGDHQFHIESGDATYNYNVLPGSVFPKEEIPCPEGALVVKGLPDLVRRAAFAASSDGKSQPMLRCISLSFTPQGLYAAASNGRQMIQVAGDRSCKGDLNVMVPAEALVTLAQMAEKDDEFRVQSTGTHVVFWHETLVFSTRAVGGAYLPVDQIFKGIQPVYTVRTKPEELLRAVQAVSNSDSNQMEIMLGENEVEFTCSLGYPPAPAKKPKDKKAQQTYAAGCFSANISLRAIITGSPGKPFYCAPNLLCAALKAMSGDITLGFSEQGHMLIRDATSRYYQTAQRGVRRQAISSAAPAAA